MGPNALHTFSVVVNSSEIPEIEGMIENVKLINPRFTSLYATSQSGSSFASISSTLVCDNIKISSTANNNNSQKTER